jgi:hypothetical protein
LGESERVLFQHCARASGSRVASVGARTELVPEPREDLDELVRHEQLPRSDAVLSCQLVQLRDTPAACEVCEGVGVTVGVVGAVEDPASREVFEVQLLHLLVARAVVVEYVVRRLGVCQEHHGGGADQAAKGQLRRNDG